MTRDSERIGAIEERLHGHEREFGRTLESIRDKLTSRELVGELYDRAMQSGYSRALGRAVRDNPIPTVLAGVCAAWLAKSVRDALTEEREAGGERTLSEVALSDTAVGGRPGEERSAKPRADGEGEAGGGREVRSSSARPDA